MDRTCLVEENPERESHPPSVDDVELALLASGMQDTAEVDESSIEPFKRASAVRVWINL